MNLSFIADDERIASLSDRAFRVHFLACSYCERKRVTAISVGAWRQSFGATPGTVNELVKAGLWREVGETLQAAHLSLSNEEKLEAKRTVELNRKHRRRHANTDTGVPQRGTEPGQSAGHERDSGVPVGGSQVPPSHTLPSPDISGSSEISSLSEASGSEELTGSARVIERKRRWTRVPATWQPNAVHRELAARLGVDFELELGKFRDHEYPAGKGKTDGDACFRTWIKNAASFNRFAPAPGLLEHQARIPDPPARRVVKPVRAEAPVPLQTVLAAQERLLKALPRPVRPEPAASPDGPKNANATLSQEAAQ